MSMGEHSAPDLEGVPRARRSGVGGVGPWPPQEAAGGRHQSRAATAANGCWLLAACLAERFRRGWEGRQGGGKCTGGGLAWCSYGGAQRTRG